MRITIDYISTTYSGGNKSWDTTVLGRLTDSRIHTKFELKKLGKSPIKLTYSNSFALSSLTQAEITDISNTVRSHVSLNVGDHVADILKDFREF